MLKGVMRKRAKPHEPATKSDTGDGTRTTVRFTHKIWGFATTMMQIKGVANFSTYLSDLIREDRKTKDALERELGIDQEQAFQAMKYRELQAEAKDTHLRKTNQARNERPSK